MSLLKLQRGTLSIVIGSVTGHGIMDALCMGGALALDTMLTISAEAAEMRTGYITSSLSKEK